MRSADQEPGRRRSRADRWGPALVPSCRGCADAPASAGGCTFLARRLHTEAARRQLLIWPHATDTLLNGGSFRQRRGRVVHLVVMSRGQVLRRLVCPPTSPAWTGTALPSCSPPARTARAT